jgi:RNA polymerase sigma-70 factor, ECF subfamily
VAATSQGLLDRLQNDNDPRAWQSWMALYEPWLRGWLRQYALQPADVDDLLQGILAIIVEKLPLFVHSGRPGAFRGWLRSILVNNVRHFLRKRGRRRISTGGAVDLLEQLEDPASEMSQRWEREHNQLVVRRTLAAIRSEFQPRTWEVFRMLVLENLPVDEVARHCGMERNAIYAAKFRVLARLRQELAGQLEG